MDMQKVIWKPQHMNKLSVFHLFSRATVSYAIDLSFYQKVVSNIIISIKQCIANVMFSSFSFRELDFDSDCASSWSLLSLTLLM